MLLVQEDHKRLFLVGMALLLFLMALVSFVYGQISINLLQVFSLFSSKLGWELQGVDYSPHGESVLWSVLWSIRLPRIILGIMVGAGLSVAGVGMQGLFRNPLAEPSLIGVSAGAAMGAVSIIVLRDSVLGWAFGSFGSFSLPLFSFGGGVGITYLVYQISKTDGRNVVLTMLLSGIAVNALAAAFIGFVIFFSDNQELREFTFWSLGSLSNATWDNLIAVIPLVVIPLFFFPFLALPLNAFLLGESEANHLGIDTQRTKTAVIFLCSSMVGATVSICGIIGFIGLVIPHLTRLILGPDNRLLIPGSALVGALLIISTDFFCRWVLSPDEFPIGIVTAIFGAPFFLLMIALSKSRGWR